METKKFIKKLIMKIACFTLFSIIVFTVMSIIAPTINNDIALGQLSNDDVSFMMWEGWNKTKQLVGIMYGCILVGFVGTIGYDTYKFIKTKGEE